MARARTQDVARLADVSLSTVSAVLNGKDIVKEETKLRILKVIKKLGYRPDLYASNLARHKTRVLGLIVSDLVNPFFAETAQSFEREANRRGFQVSGRDGVLGGAVADFGGADAGYAGGWTGADDLRV